MMNTKKHCSKTFVNFLKFLLLPTRSTPWAIQTFTKVSRFCSSLRDRHHEELDGFDSFEKFAVLWERRSTVVTKSLIQKFLIIYCSLDVDTRSTLNVSKVSETFSCSSKHRQQKELKSQIIPKTFPVPHETGTK